MSDGELKVVMVPSSPGGIDPEREKMLRNTELCASEVDEVWAEVDRWRAEVDRLRAELEQEKLTHRGMERGWDAVHAKLAYCQTAIRNYIEDEDEDRVHAFELLQAALQDEDLNDNDLTG